MLVGESLTEEVAARERRKTPANHHLPPPKAIMQSSSPPSCDGHHLHHDHLHYHHLHQDRAQVSDRCGGKRILANRLLPPHPGEAGRQAGRQAPTQGSRDLRQAGFRRCAFRRSKLEVLMLIFIIYLIISKSSPPTTPWI